MIRGYVTWQTRRDKNGYAKLRECRIAGENLLNGRRPVSDGSIFGVFIACSEALQGGDRDCENGGDGAEVVEKISARNNCNESR